MSEILAELNSTLHDVSIHMGNGDFEQDIACLYAIEDAIEQAKAAAAILGMVL